ncbi:hypothetical protein ABIF72_007765 [Bradyrhizobium japonicum]
MLAVTQMACGSGWLWYYPVLQIERTLVVKKEGKQEENVCASRIY